MVSYFVPRGTGAFSDLWFLVLCSHSSHPTKKTRRPSHKIPNKCTGAHRTSSPTSVSDGWHFYIVIPSRPVTVFKIKRIMLPPAQWKRDLTLLTHSRIILQKYSSMSWWDRFKKHNVLLSTTEINNILLMVWFLCLMIDRVKNNKSQHETMRDKKKKTEYRGILKGLIWASTKQWLYLVELLTFLTSILWGKSDVNSNLTKCLSFIFSSTLFLFFTVIKCN